MLDERVSALSLFEGMVDRLRPRAWMADSLCLEFPAVEFFPAKGQSNAEAKAVCARCLVHPECLTYAVSLGVRDGIWGGLSPQERALFEAPAEPQRFRRGTEGGALELAKRTRNEHAQAEREGYATPHARRKALAESAQAST